MRVLSVPKGLRVSASLLMFCVPFAIFQVILVTEAPSWKLPYRAIGVAGETAALLAAYLAYKLIRGRLGSIIFVAGAGALWGLASFWHSIAFGKPAHGFFAILLMLYWGLLSMRLWKEWSRSYFDHKMKWYPGVPRPLPGVECVLNPGDRGVPVHGARLEMDGAFLRNGQKGILGLRDEREVEMMFSYKGRRISCRGAPVRSIDASDGRDLAVGIQFRGMSADARKELGDFVEVLRGEGHV